MLQLIATYQLKVVYCWYVGVICLTHLKWFFTTDLLLKLATINDNTLVLHSKTVIKATSTDDDQNDCSKIKILNTTSTSYKILYNYKEWSFPLQYPIDQRVDQKFNQRLAKSHLPGQYLDIALV